MSAESKPAIIRINKMSFYGYHGVSAAEKETGQRYEVDCEFMVDIAEAASSDLLVDTIDYTQVYQIVESVITRKKFNLIETLADSIADAIVKNFAVIGVKIKLRKMTPPIPGNIDYIEIETQR